MQPIWRDLYLDSVPHEIDEHRFASLVDMFQASVKEYGKRPAVSGLGVQLTYQQLDQKSKALAAWFQSNGFKKGDRIGLMMPNIPQYLVTLYAVLRAGLTVVNINPLYTERELIHQLNDAEVKCLVVLEQFAKTVEQSLHDVALDTVLIARVGDLASLPKRTLLNAAVRHIKKQIPQYHIPQKVFWRSALCEGQRKAFQDISIHSDDIAFLQYTGGTTGVAKGAMLSHGNMVANVEQAFAWMKPHFDLGHERVAVALPLYHIFSLLANALVFMRAGSNCIMIPNARDLDSVVSAFRKHNFTVFMAVNTLLNTLMRKKSFRALDFKALHIVIAGGMSLQPAIAKKWLELTGSPVVEGFGLTEASPIVSIGLFDSSIDQAGSIGLPVPSTLVKIMNDDGDEVSVGDAGELCIKGPQVMQGYWKRLEETKNVIDPEGWLHTGDIARVDERGFVYIVDRKKDMIDVAGFNVYPNEVEAVLMECEGVLDAAVIGVAHDVAGEIVQAHVVRKDEQLTKNDILNHCRQHLVTYKLPKRIVFCNELPKNNVGKILRRVLRDQYDKKSRTL